MQPSDDSAGKAFDHPGRFGRPAHHHGSTPATRLAVSDFNNGRALVVDVSAAATLAAAGADGGAADDGGACRECPDAPPRIPTAPWAPADVAAECSVVETIQMPPSREASCSSVAQVRRRRLRPLFFSSFFHLGFAPFPNMALASRGPRRGLQRPPCGTTPPGRLGDIHACPSPPTSSPWSLPFSRLAQFAGGMALVSYNDPAGAAAAVRLDGSTRFRWLGAANRDKGSPRGSCVIPCSVAVCGDSTLAVSDAAQHAVVFVDPRNGDVGPTAVFLTWA